MPTNKQPFYHGTLKRETPSNASREVIATQFERLKESLLARELAAAATPDSEMPLSWAANDAAALAWETPAPLLVFPLLFEEIAAAAIRQANRQARLWAGQDLAAA